MKVHENPSVRTAMTIAGSDSCAGAGIQADLKTFHALGVYGTSAITAMTVQDTRKVYAVEEVDPQIVHDQIACLFEDMEIHAVKIGMVASAGIIQAVAAALAEHKGPPVVLDPVMISTSGYALLRKEARQALIERLFPLAEVVTPNLHEAQILTGGEVVTIEQMEAAARQIVQSGVPKVVVKGGHLTGKQATDVAFDGRRIHRIDGPRLETAPTHGTGCTFSSAITAFLARGCAFFDAVQQAKTYISGAIAHGFEIGRGRRLAHHFWKDAND